MSHAIRSILPTITVSNIDNAWKLFYDKLMQISNKYTPIKTFGLKNHNTPWISKQIIGMMYKRDYLHKKARKLKKQ